MRGSSSVASQTAITRREGDFGPASMTSPIDVIDMGRSVRVLFHPRARPSRRRPVPLWPGRPAVPDVRRWIAGDLVEDIACQVHRPEIATADRASLEEEAGPIRGPRRAASDERRPGTRQLADPG